MTSMFVSSSKATCSKAGCLRASYRNQNACHVEDHSAVEVVERKAFKVKFLYILQIL